MAVRESAPDEPARRRRAISYEQWGIDFFLEAISEERVLGAVNTIAGQPIDFGPMGVGPGRIAKVRAYGEIGAADATRQRGDRDQPTGSMLPVEPHLRGRPPGRDAPVRGRAARCR